MKKIISFSLWGDNKLYWTGALENLKLAYDLYPDWICRFYIDEVCNTQLIKKLQGRDCEILFMKKTNSLSGLLWRFLAAEDSDIMICRDADSRLSTREKEAVNDWLRTDKNFHIMRDHPEHRTLIPGGMWGCRNIEGIKDMVLSFPIQLQGLKGHDQFFLAKYIYPQIQSSALIHDSYNLFGDSIDFPTLRDGNEFVGAVVDV